MRYRRSQVRYTLVLASEAPRLGSDWHAERAGVLIAQPRWRPPTDVYETASSLVVTLELAGVEQDELDVVLYDNALVIEGQRRLLNDEPGVYHCAEIRQGAFRVEVPLPAPVDPDGIEARYDRGLLQIVVLKPGRAARHGG